MSVSTVTATSMSIATPTQSQCITHEIPISDAACAVPFSDANTKAMSDCCNGAAVVSYFNNCGLYCVAAGQTINDLHSCLASKGGVANQAVFCNAVNTASATNTAPSVPATASASVISGGKGGSNNGTGSDAGNGDSSSGNPDNGSDGKTGGSTKGNDAVKVGGISVLGVSLGAMIFSAFAFGGLAV